MSAWVVSKGHIDALVELGRYIKHGPLRWPTVFEQWGFTNQLTDANLAAVGQMLMDCCVESVSYRYQDNEEVNTVNGVPRTHPELPGPISQYWRTPYKFAPVGRVLTPVEGIKLVHCYSYQSCEHPGWNTSQGRSYCQQLEASLIRNLPGYDSAPWDFDEGRGGE